MTRKLVGIFSKGMLSVLAFTLIKMPNPDRCSDHLNLQVENGFRPKECLRSRLYGSAYVVTTLIWIGLGMVAPLFSIFNESTAKPLLRAERHYVSSIWTAWPLWSASLLLVSPGTALCSLRFNWMLTSSICRPSSNDVIRPIHRCLAFEIICHGGHERGKFFGWHVGAAKIAAGVRILLLCTGKTADSSSFLEDFGL